jgi:RNA polymerase sigma-54 factor
MHYSLSTRLSQQTSLSPQLQQAVKLLLLSSMDLEAELEKAVADNPVLLFEPSNLQFAAGADVHEFDQAARRPSLQASLTEQINLLRLEIKTQTAVHYLAACLDKRGFLDTSLENITLEITEFFQENYTLHELQNALKHLQTLEPVGIGARDLSECLALQLQDQLDTLCFDPEEREITLLALQICSSHLPKVANCEFAKLRVLLGKSEKSIEAAVTKIKSLKHNPAAEFDDDPDLFIRPDLFVKKHRGLWVAERNEETVPKISLNQEYIEILKEYRDKNEIGAMRQKISEAKWLIKNIQQREETIQRVACEIVARQQSFFHSGDIALRPLVLREIADNLELHESTVSRVTNQKYLGCPLGLFELKHFFSHSITSEQGDRISTTAVQEIIKRIVADESPGKPISDHSIAMILENQGYVIARRTVAKYRESLRIPAMHLRRH